MGTDEELPMREEGAGDEHEELSLHKNSPFPTF